MSINQNQANVYWLHLYFGGNRVFVTLQKQIAALPYVFFFLETSRHGNTSVERSQSIFVFIVRQAAYQNVISSGTVNTSFWFKKVIR